MKVSRNNGNYVVFGQSTDTKPTPVVSDKEYEKPSLFLFCELDTGDIYFYNESTTSWDKTTLPITLAITVN